MFARSSRFWPFMAAVFAAGLLAVVLWRVLQPQDDAWERLRRGGALRVALDPSFPPFETVDAEGRLSGFDVDLAREIAARLDVPLEFKAIAFDGLVDAVLADKADLVISAFPLDPRLTQDVRYSRPYFEAGLVLVSKGKDPATGPEDLEGRLIAVEWGSLGDAWARGRGLDIVRVETAAEALQAVAANKADFAVVDAVTAALDGSPDLVIHAPPLESDPYVIVSSLRASRLSQMVDETLGVVLTDGTWERLVSAYFPLTPIRPGG